MNDIKDLLKDKDFVHGSKAPGKEIEKLESALCTKFANDYRTLLIEYSAVMYNGHELAGFSRFPRRNVVDVTRKNRFTYNIPDEMYVIEELGIDSIIACQDESGTVYFIAPNTKPQKVAGSLLEYLES